MSPLRKDEVYITHRAKSPQWARARYAPPIHHFRFAEGDAMRKLAAALFISVVLLIAGLTGMQVAGDVVPGGNGSSPYIIQVAGDVVPGGNG
jgi:hypothetical protein